MGDDGSASAQRLMTRRRLDQELLRRELVTSRSQARELIEAGKVLVSGAVADKAARLVDGGDPVVVTGEGPRFVSRGGEKLDAALDRFAIEVSGRRVIDAGASTGGFTDCVLQRGACEVVAIDVGHGQLHEHVRADPRVDVRERVNVRHLGPDDIGGSASLVVADLSFISLRTVLPNLVSFADPHPDPTTGDGADLVVLVKPQFEAGRTEANKGRGVIRDPAVWDRVLNEVIDTASALGLGIMGVMLSPLRGADGNTEFLLHARVGQPSADETRVLVSAALAEAGDIA